MNKEPDFNLGQSRALRNAGIDRVLKAAGRRWLRRATIILLTNFPKGWEGRPEELWPTVVAKIGAPHRGQVWSGLTNSLKAAGLFTHFKDNKGDQCEKRSNHARWSRWLRKLV